jgi:hypothetical protein
MVLRWRKCLSGLKKFSHVGYGTYGNNLISVGIEASWIDTALFVVHDTDQCIVIAAIIL